MSQLRNIAGDIFHGLSGSATDKGLKNGGLETESNDLLFFAIAALVLSLIIFYTL